MTSRKLGFAYDVTPGVDPITAGADYYYLGARTQPHGNYPNPKFNIQSIYRGSRDPTIRIANADLPGTLRFAPVNAVPWYLALGQSSTTTGLHTITGIDNGELPQFTTRWQVGNTDIIKSMSGNKVKTLNFELVELNGNVRMPAFMGINTQATNFGAPTYASDKTPVYPDSVSDMYYKDANFAFNWDSSADNVDYSSDLMNFRTIIDTTNRFLPLMQQLFPDAVGEGTRATIINFDLLRIAGVTDTSIYDDFVAQTRSSTGKNLHLKIYQTSTKYLQLDFTNVFLKECDINDQNESKNEDGKYKVVGIAESLTVKSNDGLTASTFYGE